MHRTRRHLIAAGTAAVSVLALVPAAAFAGTDKASIDWRPCAEAPEIDCATIEVPLDYADPQGETIAIALARRPAANPDERIGSILMNTGGPGNSGTEAVITGEYGLAADAAERFDLIGFDPRGVGDSTRILCDAERVAALETSPVPESEAQFTALRDASAAAAESCRDLTGPLADHADNLHTVEDIERIRRALGEGDLNFIGYSYGTLMGQQYAEAYPQHIRSMVLDSNQDHSQETMWEFISAETEAFEAIFAEFAGWCDATEDCALYGEDTAATYDELQERARAGELVHPSTGKPLDFYGLSGFAFQATRPATWPSLAEGLRAMRDGTSVPTGFAPEAAATGAEYPGMAEFCQDWGYRIDEFAAWESLTSRLSEEYPLTEWSPYAIAPLRCSGSGMESANPHAPLDVEGAPELLVVGAVRDYATPYRWSEAVAEQTDSAVVTYEGYAHAVYGRVTPCVDEAVDAYFIDLELPAAGFTCPAV